MIESVISGESGKMMQECIKWCKAHPNALKYTDGTYGDEYLMVRRMV